nr:MAG TPA: hypothetical protein [Caudoviricetes sp.]
MREGNSFFLCYFLGFFNVSHTNHTISLCILPIR